MRVWMGGLELEDCQEKEEWERGRMEGSQRTDRWTPAIHHSIDGVEMASILEGDENILPVRLENMGEAPESCDWWMQLSDR